jgi:hypothetical protein
MRVPRLPSHVLLRNLFNGRKDWAIRADHPNQVTLSVQNMSDHCHFVSSTAEQEALGSRFA